MSGVRSEIVTQVQSLFASFGKSLDGRFSTIDERFSQVMSNTKVTDDSINVSKNVINRSFAAPSPVAVHTEHPLDKAPSVPYTDDLGITLGGPAAANAPLGDPSLPCMSFSDLPTIVRIFESSGSGIPDSFLNSLRN